MGNLPVELEGALLQSTFDLVSLCEYWNPMTAVDNMAVSSPIPTLILVGQYDVATPPRWATLTAATLPNSYLFLVPGAGHSPCERFRHRVGELVAHAGEARRGSVLSLC